MIKGVYFTSSITKKIAIKGSRSLEYQFVVNGKKYEFERFVNREFYYDHKIGDTLIIKVLLDELPESLVCEDIDYQNCFGKQPENGWKEIPICK